MSCIGKVEPTALIGMKLATGLGLRTSDVLNLCNNGSLAFLKAGHHTLFRLPHPVVRYLEDPGGARREFKSWNNYTTLKEDFYGFSNLLIRSKMMAQVARLLAQVEARAGLNRIDYKVTSSKDTDPGKIESRIKQELSNSVSGIMLDKIELGEALDALGQLSRQSSTSVSYSTHIPLSVLSLVQADQVELMLTVVDRLALMYGLTFDELIWLKYPSPTRPIFHIEERASYKETENVQWWGSQTALDKFTNGSVHTRAELMLSYHQWWERENQPKSPNRPPGIKKLQWFTKRTAMPC